MDQPIIHKSYLVEIPIPAPANQQQINFNFIPQLEGSTIYGVSAYASPVLSTSPNGATLVSAAGLAAIAVTFAVGDNQDVYLMPCVDLYSPTIGGFIRIFNNKKLNLTKSYITILNAGAITANQAVCFNFIYR